MATTLYARGADVADRIGCTLHEVISEMVRKHPERIRTDPRYAMVFAYMQEASKPAEPSRHYDRDGYCDNPARGY